MFAEFNVNGRRMRIEPRPKGRMVVLLRKRFLFVFSYWAVVATAEGYGLEPMFTGFFNEAKSHGQDVLRLVKRMKNK